jgi:hypothetical protein
MVQPEHRREPVLSNNPEPTADPLVERLATQYAPLRARAEELAAGLANVPAAVDDSTIDRATGYVKQIKLCAKEAEDARKAEKDDFLQAGRKVDGFFKELAALLEQTADAVEKRVQVYLRAKADEERRRREEAARIAREAAAAAEAEARRIREEEEALRAAAAAAEAARIAALTPAVDPNIALAAQRAAEEQRQRDEDAARERELQSLQAAREAREAAAAAEQAANAKAADLARTRGAFGGTATLATTIAAEITDKQAAVRALAQWFDEESVLKAIRAYGRANKAEVKRDIAAGKQPVSGVRFYEEYAARVA